MGGLPDDPEEYREWLAKGFSQNTFLHTRAGRIVRRAFVQMPDPLLRRNADPDEEGFRAVALRIGLVIDCVLEIAVEYPKMNPHSLEFFGHICKRLEDKWRVDQHHTRRVLRHALGNLYVLFLQSEEATNDVDKEEMDDLFMDSLGLLVKLANRTGEVILDELRQHLAARPTIRYYRNDDEENLTETGGPDMRHTRNPFLE